MEQNQSSELDLKTINCHFTWNLIPAIPSSEPRFYINNLEPDILRDVERNVINACHGYLTLAFAYTIGDGDKLIDHNKALEYIERAQNQSTTNAEKYVVLADKLWILSTKQDEISDYLVEKLRELEQGLTDSDKADLLIIEALALSCFEYHPRAQEKYKEAVALNPENGYAYIGIAKMYSKLRRRAEFAEGIITNNEMDAWEHAKRLLPENPLPFIYHALALADSLRFCANEHKLDVVRNITRLVQIASDNADANAFAVNVGSVSTWAAKCYKTICDFVHMPQFKYRNMRQKQMIFLEKALKHSPNDGNVQHQAGRFFMLDPKLGDMEKAEECLMKAIEYSPPKLKISSEVLLIQLRKLKDPKYDALKNYRSLLPKYREVDLANGALARLHELIAIEHDALGDFEMARKEFANALSEQLPRLPPLVKTNERLQTLLEDLVNDSVAAYVAGTMSESQYIENLAEAAKTYLLYQPKKLYEAKGLYERILEVDQENNAIRLSLCHVLIEMELYEECSEEAIRLGDEDKAKILKKIETK